MPLLTLTLIPALCWLWYYYRTDRDRPEPPRLVARVALMGAAAAIPASLLEAGLMARLPGSSFRPFLTEAIGFLLIAGPVEEALKFLVVYRFAYHEHAFDEPSDGIRYAVAAAVGFASLENAFYALAAGPGVLLVRGPWCTLGHITFSAVWGSALGAARFHPGGRPGAVARGLVAAALVHGVANLLLNCARMETLPGYLLAAMVLPLTLGLFALAQRELRRAERERARLGH